MTDLIRSQIDFIYFVYGLGFILLLPISLYLHRRPKGSLPWMWLLLFGATHGLLEWLELVALSLGTDPVFDVVRLGLMILSFLLLAEFGRAGLVRLRGRGPGRWVLAVLLGLALLGAFAGLPGVRASARYALGLVGALGAAAALWLAAHRARPRPARSPGCGPLPGRLCRGCRPGGGPRPVFPRLVAQHRCLPGRGGRAHPVGARFSGRRPQRLSLVVCRGLPGPREAPPPPEVGA